MLDCKVLRVDANGMDVQISTDRFAQDVCLCVLSKYAEYSDNAFDLDAGETCIVHISLPKDLRCGKRLRIQACNSKAVRLDWMEENQL